MKLDTIEGVTSRKQIQFSRFLVHRFVNARVSLVMDKLFYLDFKTDLSK